MKKKILFLSTILFLAGTFAVFGQDAAKPQTSYVYWKWISAAAAVGLSCIGGGIAVGQIGAAAMGAMSENPELSGKALPFIGLAEGICLWGFLVALLILFI
jgi:V/A-type H+/Na+-transporting ATPase subunit K